MAVKLLTAINSILPKLGEHVVTSTTAKHPTLAILLPIIDQTLDDLTIDGWWFNTFDQTLYPSSEGEIVLPSDTLSFLPEAGKLGVVRGTRLYDAANQTFVWTGPVKGERITRVPFEELPESAAAHVFYYAMVSAYVTDIGLEKDVQIWQTLSSAAQTRMESEHLRNRRYTTRSSWKYQQIHRALRA